MRWEFNVSVDNLARLTSKLQNPAYRATLLSIRWAQVETALTFLFKIV